MQLLITVLILVIVFYLVYWLIGQIPFPAPLANIRWVFYVILVLIALYVLFKLLPIDLGL